MWVHLALGVPRSPNLSGFLLSLCGNTVSYPKDPTVHYYSSTYTLRYDWWMICYGVASSSHQSTRCDSMAPGIVLRTPPGTMTCASTTASSIGGDAKHSHLMLWLLCSGTTYTCSTVSIVVGMILGPLAEVLGHTYYWLQDIVVLLWYTSV